MEAVLLVAVTSDGRSVQVGALGRGEIPRADVAAVLASVLSTDATIGSTFDLLTGHQTIEAALAGL